MRASIVLRPALAAALVSFVAPASVIAGPESSPVLVTQVRPYVAGGVYVDVNSNELCGTGTFLIHETAPGRKEMYAAVLTAIASSKRIRLEVASCTGWGTPLQSVYLVSD